MLSTLLVVLAIIVMVLAVVFASIRGKQKGMSSERLTSSAKDGQFSVLQGEIDGHPVFATIDMGLRGFREMQLFPFFLSVGTSLARPNSYGLPTDDEAANLNAWEDAVEARLRLRSKYVFLGRITMNGKRELLYYVDSQQLAMEELTSLSEANSTRHFAFTCVRDEEWRHAQVWTDCE